MTTEPTPLVTALPCDGERTFALMEAIRDKLLPRAFHEVEQVVADNLAAHRLAALEEAAAKCLEVSAWIGAGAGSSIDSALQEAATAIRSLSNKTGEGAQDSAAFARPTDPSDAKWAFWLNDAASILQSNGTETHADWVRRAAERFAHPTPGDSPCK